MKSETSPYFLSPSDDAVPIVYKVKIFFFPSTNGRQRGPFRCDTRQPSETLELVLLSKGNIAVILTATQLGTQAITGPFRGINEQIVSASN